MIDVSELEDYARRIDAAKADLKPYAERFLQEAGEEFLTICQEQIQRADNIDLGKLQGSFVKGGAGNIWQIDMGSLTLTIGSDIEYAKWVNKGHKQQPGRFIPGEWQGKHFRYIPGHSSGMVLKASWVQGSFFFDKAIETFQKMFPVMEQSAFDQFWSRYF